MEVCTSSFSPFVLLCQKHLSLDNLQTKVSFSFQFSELKIQDQDSSWCSECLVCPRFLLQKLCLVAAPSGGDRPTLCPNVVKGQRSRRASAISPASVKVADSTPESSTLTAPSHKTPASHAVTLGLCFNTEFWEDPYIQTITQRESNLFTNYCITPSFKLE